jgi:hypothetical protein
VFNPIRHNHSHLSNQEVEWFSIDDAGLFKEAMANPNKRKLIEDNGWSNSSFTYKFNSHGFRSDEFSHEDSIMFLGASVVLGTGIPNENTWTHIVSQKLGLRNFNLGVSGGSNDTSFRLAEHYIPQLKPKIIVHVTSYADRVDLITEDNICTMLHNGFHLPERYQKFYKDWVTIEENGLLNLKKNRYAIRYICQMQGIRLIEAEGSELWPWPPLPDKDLSRDLYHPGVNSNKEIADKILELVTVVGFEPTTFGV